MVIWNELELTHCRAGRSQRPFPSGAVMTARINALSALAHLTVPSITNRLARKLLLASD